MAKRCFASKNLAEMGAPEATHWHGKAIDQVNVVLGRAKAPDPVAVHALLNRLQIGRLAHEGRASAQGREPDAPVAVKLTPNLLVLAHSQVCSDHFERQLFLIAQGRRKAALSQRRTCHCRVGFTNLAVHIDNEFIEGHVRLLQVS